MNRFFKLLFITLGIGLFVAQASLADEYRVLVLPDNIQFDSTNYYIYPDSATIFASDTINEIKKDGRIHTVSMTEVRDTLRKNTKLSILTKKALKEFKYNYNIPFVDFKAIANAFSTDKVLVITSQTDVQNYALKRTIWDWLNVPGSPVVDPSYKLSTYAALIDVNKEEVIWQNTFHKKISSCEGRMLAQSFAPATEQLEKIKSYSSYFLSPVIANMIETNILPPPIIGPNGGGILPVSNKKQSNTVNFPPLISPMQEDIDLKPRTIIPTRTNLGTKGFGAMVNDL